MGKKALTTADKVRRFEKIKKLVSRKKVTNIMEFRQIIKKADLVTKMTDGSVLNKQQDGSYKWNPDFVINTKNVEEAYASDAPTERSVSRPAKRTNNPVKDLMTRLLESNERLEAEVKELKEMNKDMEVEFRRNRITMTNISNDVDCLLHPEKLDG